MGKEQTAADSPPRPRPLTRGAIFAHAGGELNFPGSDSDLFFKIRSVCVRVYMCVYLYMCLRVCVCIYTCIYKYIYIYVLKRISFPSGRELGGGTRASAPSGWKNSALCLQHYSVPARPGTGRADSPSDLSPISLPFSLAPHQPPVATSLQEAKRQHNKASNSQT